MKRALAFAVWLAVGVAAVTAQGEQPNKPMVVLLRPDPPDPALSQMFVRIEGELETAGFAVTLVAKPADEDPRIAIDKASSSLTPAAVIGVFGDPNVGMELWLADRLSGKSLVRHLSASGESGSRASEILAIRAAEQLSAGLVELDLWPKPAPVAAAARPVEVAPVATPEPKPSAAPNAARSRFAAELGIGSLFSFEHAGPTVTPVARLSWLALPSWQVRVTGAWLGSRSSLSAASGSATYSQDLLLAEGVFSPAKPGKLGLRASLGVGTLHVGVQGRGAGSVQGLDNSIWAAAVDAGAGLGYERAASWGFAFEAHAVFASPYPVVRLLDEARATTGRPAVFASLVLVGDL
jgi:hypothetical protein